MFVQTQNTPNPNSLKFVPGKKVSKIGPVEVLDLKDTNNELIRNILSINGILSVFLYEDFLSVNKTNDASWNDLKPMVISHLNDYFEKNNEPILKDNTQQKNITSSDDETIKKIIDVLDTKIRPAVAKDGGDIKFKSFENGVVKVELQGSCSGCPSSIMTLKQGVQNLLKHYVKEVNSVEAN